MAGSAGASPAPASAAQEQGQEQRVKVEELTAKAVAKAGDETSAGAAVTPIANSRSISSSSSSSSCHASGEAGEVMKCQWTEELHKGFLAAIFDLGLAHAKPLEILKFWVSHPPNVSGEHIKSHLQKYRKNAERTRLAFQAQLETSIREARRINARASLVPHLHAYPICGSSDCPLSPAHTAELGAEVEVAASGDGAAELGAEIAAAGKEAGASDEGKAGASKAEASKAEESGAGEARLVRAPGAGAASASANASICASASATDPTKTSANTTGTAPASANASSVGSGKRAPSGAESERDGVSKRAKGWSPGQIRVHEHHHMHLAMQKTCQLQPQLCHEAQLVAASSQASTHNPHHNLQQPCDNRHHMGAPPFMPGMPGIPLHHPGFFANPFLSSVMAFPGFHPMMMPSGMPLLYGQHPCHPLVGAALQLQQRQQQQQPPQPQLQQQQQQQQQPQVQHQHQPQASKHPYPCSHQDGAAFDEFDSLCPFDLPAYDDADGLSFLDANGADRTSPP
jgi:SHAQKYF class myb-like DNA-binding protein